MDDQVINLKNQILLHADTILQYLQINPELKKQNSIENEIAKISLSINMLRKEVSRLDLFSEYSNSLSFQEEKALLGNIRHDIRSPLNGIKGYSEIIVEKLEESQNLALRGNFLIVLEIANQILFLVNLIQSSDEEHDSLDTQDDPTPLPVKKPARKSSAAKKKKNKKNLVLVVDDSETNRNVLSDWLTHKNYRVLTAENGDQALALVAEHNDIDVILLDILMPELDGYQVLQHIRANKFHRNIPIIMISGVNEMGSIVHCIEKGAEDYLIKPFNPFLLSARINACIGNKQLRDREKAYRRKIVEEKNYVGSIINSMSNMLIVSNDSLVIQKVNPATENILHYTEDELIGKNLFSIFGKEMEREKNYKLLTSPPQALNSIENSFITKEGERISVLMSYAHLLDSNKKLKNIVCVSQNINDLKKMQEKFIYQATHDILTDLPNRFLLLDRINQKIVQSKRNKTEVAILLVDLDRFKHINDSLGHDMGDVLLKTISARLKAAIRTSDTIARLGGDEFIIAIPITETDNIHEIIQRYMDAISEPLQLGKYFLRITASIGISLFPKDGSEASTLIKNADIALYKVKDSGRSNYMFYSRGMKQKTLQYMNLETDLNNALEKKEFTIYYQPILNAQTLKIEGMEALLRWKHPKFGIIMPEKFINLAEVIGVICPVGEWALKTACQQQREWELQNLPPTMISVNLSTYQFREKDGIVDIVKRVIRETNIDPKYLELELTETALIRNTKNVRKSLVALKKLGITITIDDFGTGYSNLHYLKQFPIDKIKIDKVFIQNLPKSLKDATIVDGIISMANKLDIKITIEGVETEEQLQHLRTEFGHIPYSIQGFYFSKPLEAIEATALLKKERL